MGGLMDSAQAASGESVGGTRSQLLAAATAWERHVPGQAATGTTWSPGLRPDTWMEGLERKAKGGLIGEELLGSGRERCW